MHSLCFWCIWLVDLTGSGFDLAWFCFLSFEHLCILVIMCYINIETVSGPCNTCFWYARAPAVRNTSFLTAGARAYQKHVLHGPEIVSIFIANLRAIFNDILRKISTIFYAKTWDFLYCGRSLDVVVTFPCRADYFRLRLHFLDLHIAAGEF